jgi:hypothetical protein
MSINVLITFYLWVLITYITEIDIDLIICTLNKNRMIIVTDEKDLFLS